MKAKKTIRILLALLLGAVTAFILLEAGLRILGVVYTRTTTPPAQDVVKGVPGHFSIMCIGASWTAGVGAPSGRGFPEQLEEVLAEQYPDKDFTVFKKAVVSQNTAQVLERLPYEIEQVDPDIVVILTGVANSWNHWGLVRFREGERGWAVDPDSIERIRTYKLAKILVSDIADITRQRHYRAEREREKKAIYEMVEKDGGLSGSHRSAHAGMRFLRTKNVIKAEENFLKGIALDPSYSGNYRGMGLVEMQKGSFEEAIGWFTKAIERNPGNSANHGQIGFAYFRQTRFREAGEWFEKALEVNPDNAPWYGGYLTMAVSYERSGQQEKAREARKHARNLPDVHRIAHSRVPDLQAADFRAWIITDFREMVDVCREKGVEVILQTFPNDAYDKYDIGINRAIREAALEKEVPFVDHEILFEEYFIISGSNRDDYFEFPGNDGHQTGEGHCNEAGYRLMAENIYGVIEQWNLLEKVQSKR